MKNLQARLDRIEKTTGKAALQTGPECIILSEKDPDTGDTTAAIPYMIQGKARQICGACESETCKARALQ